MSSAAMAKRIELEDALVDIEKSAARKVLFEFVAKTFEMKGNIQSMKTLALGFDVDSGIFSSIEDEMSRVARSTGDLVTTFDRFAKKFGEDCYERIVARAKEEVGE